jgi:NADH:ubiquinone oxidoreductase subunit K
MLPEPTFNSYLMLSTVLLSVGLAGVFLQRTAVGMLLSVQVMVGGITLAFTAGDRYFARTDGQILSVVVIAATLVHLALVVALSATDARHRHRYRRGSGDGRT